MGGGKGKGKGDGKGKGKGKLTKDPEAAFKAFMRSQKETLQKWAQRRSQWMGTRRRLPLYDFGCPGPGGRRPPHT